MQEQGTDFKLCCVVAYVNNFYVAVTFSTTQSLVVAKYKQKTSLPCCISLATQHNCKGWRSKFPEISQSFP